MQKISELLNIKVTEENPLTIYHPIFKDKKVYWECSDGNWDKSKYDSNGNLIYFENSSGGWSKSKYDSNGNQVYYEDSYGDWEKYEFDSNSKEIYFEDSYGKIIDKRVTELTLDQIAEKFGISVNQLKIKK